MKKLKNIFLLGICIAISSCTHIQGSEKLVDTAFFDFHNVLVLPKNMATRVGLFVRDIVLPHKRAFFSVLCNPYFYKGLRSQFNMPNNRGTCKITENYLNFIAELGYPALAQALIEYANNSYTENPAMENLLEKLQNNQTNLYLFSNMGPKTEQDARLKFPLLNKYFKQSNLIDTHNTWKPEAQAFEGACKSANCQPQQVVVIDDKAVNGYNQEACTLAAAKARKKGHAYCPPTNYSAGAIVYHARNHQKAIEKLTALGLLSR